MNHISKQPAILWYIDSVTHSFGLYILNGWMLHTNQDIKSIEIGGVDLITYRFTRKDVKETYPHAGDVDKIGFEITLDKSQIDTPLTIRLMDNTTMQIESVYKFIAFRADFNEGHKNLIVVDNFYKNPDLIRDYVMNNLTFQSTTASRGKRSNERFFVDGTKEELEKILGRKILNWESDEYSNGIFQYCTSYDPIVIHADIQQFAGVVYLTPDAPLETGTKTYRSKVTGKKRFEDSFEEGVEETFRGISEDFNYYDKTQFETVDEIANVYNRLVLWDAKAIHSASDYFGDTINNARFFQLFFFDVE